MIILGISGSLRKGSSNTALLNAAAKLLPENTQWQSAPPLDGLPYMNPDLDGENAPASVQGWREAVASAAGLIICSPEYAHGIPGVLKNALDWLVPSGELYEKPTTIINASPNYLGAQRVSEALSRVLNAQQARLREDAFTNIAGIYNKLDANGNLLDEETRQILRNALENFTGDIQNESGFAHSP